MPSVSQRGNNDVLQPLNETEDLAKIIVEVHEMLLRFERKMAVGHVVMIWFLVIQVALLIAMTIGIWRH